MTFCPWKLPQKPRLRTIPLPPVDPGHNDGGFDEDDNDDNFPGGGINDHQSIEQWTASAQWAEVTTGLAPTKPKDIENNNQLEVSRVFTPLEIVLYSNGLDSSQVVQLPRVRVMVRTPP